VYLHYFAILQFFVTLQHTHVDVR